MLAVLAPRAASAEEPLEVRASRGLRGVLPAGGADFVQLRLRNRTAQVQSGNVRVDEGGPASFSVPAGGVAHVVVVRQLPPRINQLAPATATITIGKERSFTHLVPAAEVVDQLSLVVAAAPAFVAQSARQAGHLRGRAVLMSAEDLPRTWLALRGIDTVFVRVGDAPRLEARALAVGARVCRMGGDGYRCSDGLGRYSVTAYPARPGVGAGMGSLANLAALGAVWLLLLAVGWRYVGSHILGGVAVALPLLILLVMPGARLAPATVVADGHYYYTAGDAQAFVVARVRGRRGLSNLPAIGRGELWLRPDSSDALRGELAQFQPLRWSRFRDQRIWRVEGFIDIAADPPAWSGQLTPVEADRGAQ